MKSLGGGFKTKPSPGSAAGSGSGANHEDAAESAAPVDLAPVVNVTENVEDAEKVDEGQDVGEGPIRVPKKRKLAGSKPQWPGIPWLEKSFVMLKVRGKMTSMSGLRSWHVPCLKSLVILTGENGGSWSKPSS